MKKLLLVGAAAMVSFSGCYKKEVAPESSAKTLTTTRWVIDKHVPVKAGGECAIASEIVLNADSTGYYVYPTKCASDDVDTLRFNWHLSAEEANMYYSNVGGDPNFRVVVGVSDYRYDALELRCTVKYKNRFLDGIFVANGPR
ncbi:MAG: hypothetical protein JNM41_06870 [Flavipsychrobacter sp.]|nr:hypothetical protein [Flavipsychrobacter sp.]